MRQNAWTNYFGAALLLSLTGAALAWMRPAAAQSKNSPPIEIRPGITMLTPAEDVDFGPYLAKCAAGIKRNWYALMPESALQGEKGIAAVEFQILHDGTLTAMELRPELGTGKEALDRAAMGAIKSSAPFDHLPDDFQGQSIKLRVIFFYNLPTDSPESTTPQFVSRSNPATKPSGLALPSPPLISLPAPATIQRTNPGSRAQLTVEISSATPEDVDFRTYSKEVTARLKRNWHVFAPESALDREKGTVTVRFHIQRDGTLLEGEPILVSGSGNEVLDNAALEAIRKSVPFEHLPVAFDGRMIRLRCIFKSGLDGDS